MLGRRAAGRHVEVGKKRIAVAPVMLLVALCLVAAGGAETHQIPIRVTLTADNHRPRVSDSPSVQWGYCVKVRTAGGKRLDTPIQLHLQILAGRTPVAGVGLITLKKGYDNWCGSLGGEAGVLHLVPVGRKLIFQAVVRALGVTVKRNWPIVVQLTRSASTVGAGKATSTSICTSAQVHLRASFYGEAGGEFTQTITVTNTGARECRLAGWPSVRVRTSSGQTTALPSIRVVQGAFGAVSLRPGAVASFDIFGADYDALDNRVCPRTHALNVALPGAAPRPIAVTLPYCGPFFVAPLIAGKTDREAWSTIWAKRWCRIQQFTVSVGPKVSEATGQHTLALRLTNRGNSCTLYGRPALWFEDSHGGIPFQLRTGTDQMIAATYALPVVVRRGGSAWVVINHYRCDLGVKRAASVIRIGLQDAAYSATIRFTIRDPFRQIDYCGRVDPGSTITIAPFESTFTAAFHR